MKRSPPTGLRRAPCPTRCWTRSRGCLGSARGGENGLVHGRSPCVAQCAPAKLRYLRRRVAADMPAERRQTCRTRRPPRRPDRSRPGTPGRRQGHAGTPAAQTVACSSPSRRRRGGECEVRRPVLDGVIVQGSGSHSIRLLPVSIPAVFTILLIAGVIAMGTAALFLLILLLVRGSADSRG